MIKAVIFDLDDTLYPEFAYVESGLEKVASFVENKYNLQGVQSTIMALFMQDKNDVYGRLLAKLGIKDQQVIKEMVIIYRENKPKHLPFYGDTIKTIEGLLQKNIKLGIITDGRVSGQQNKIAALRLEKYIKNIIITDSFGGESFRKPHPISFEKMKQLLDVDFPEMMYVGDNREKDFFIKSTYPITTVEVVRCGGIYENGEYLGGILPDYCIDDLQKLLDII